MNKSSHCNVHLKAIVHVVKSAKCQFFLKFIILKIFPTATKFLLCVQPQYRYITELNMKAPRLTILSGAS